LLQVLTFDNGADYFSEGLTRSLVGGKIAYFDRSFHQVISPKYDWGWPFEAGRALVCLGCSPTGFEKDGHSSVDGGKWGFIDKSGKEVVRVKLVRQKPCPGETTRRCNCNGWYVARCVFRARVTADSG
jgi:hypothetical protein